MHRRDPTARELAHRVREGRPREGPGRKLDLTGSCSRALRRCWCCRDEVARGTTRLADHAIDRSFAPSRWSRPAGFACGMAAFFPLLEGDVLRCVVPGSHHSQVAATTGSPKARPRHCDTEAYSTQSACRLRYGHWSGTLRRWTRLQNMPTGYWCTCMWCRAPRDPRSRVDTATRSRFVSRLRPRAVGRIALSSSS